MYVYTNMLGVVESKEGFETKEEAEMNFFKNEEFLILDRIRKSKENIQKNERELEKLRNKFSHLKNISPKDFI